MTISTTKRTQCTSGTTGETIATFVLHAIIYNQHETQTATHSEGVWERERAESIKYINVPQMQTKLTTKHQTTTMTMATATASTKTSGWQEISRIKYEITCQHFNSMGRHFFLWMNVSEWVSEWGTSSGQQRSYQTGHIRYFNWLHCHSYTTNVCICLVKYIRGMTKIYLF